MFRTQLAVFTLAVAAVTGASAATIIFDNQSDHQGGTFVYLTGAGGTASLTGGLIDRVVRVEGIVTQAVTDGCLGFGCINFTTGAFIDSSPIAAGGNSYRYGPGGSLTITGTSGAASGTLFTSTFSSSVTVNVPAGGIASLSGSLAAGTLNSVLAAFFGVNPASSSGSATNSDINVVLSVGGGTGTGSTNSVQAVTTDIARTPEPGTMLLLGAGLVGVGVSRRRRA